MIKRIYLMLMVMAVAIAASAADVDAVLKELKARIAPDGRVAIWNVKSTMEGDMAVIDGIVGYQDQLEAINAELDNLNISYRNNVKVLANDVPANKQWALVKLSIATLRCEPKHSAEVATQGLSRNWLNGKMLNVTSLLSMTTSSLLSLKEMRL